MLFFDVTFNIYLTAQSTHSINITACMGASSLLNCQHPTQSCLRRVHLRLSSQCTELRGGSSAHAHHCGGDEFIMAGLVQRVVHINILILDISVTTDAGKDACYISYARTHLWLPRSGGVLIMHA